MSCIDAGSEIASKTNTLEFAASRNFALNEVSAYLANSDFMVRNVVARENTLTVVFEKNRTGGSCFLLDAISIDGNLVIVELSNDGKNNYTRIQSVRLQ